MPTFGTVAQLSASDDSLGEAVLVDGSCHPFKRLLLTVLVVHSDGFC